MLVKGLVPRWFWFTSFAAANVLIDVEVLVHIWRRQPPLHRICHTYPVAALIGLAAGLLMYLAVRLVCRFDRRRWPGLREAADRPRAHLLAGSIAGGVTGGLSHVFLDGLLYRGMQPFWPLADGNPLTGTVSGRVLCLVCVATGTAGIVIWLVMRAVFGAERKEG